MLNLLQVAFQHWLEVLLKNAVLDSDTIGPIGRIYLQSGIVPVKWETIPDGHNR
ncbi:DUF1281 domain-containing protein [Yersinia enterocolitica]|nr:DUF1281 domain-containing protein [Yersinia enterocolitica]